MFKLKRAYESPEPDDGKRVLVERLWPRGVSRKKAALDLWLKEVAPSSGLRKWFGHDPGKWEEFCRRYRQELEGEGEAIQRLRELGRGNPVTLVYAARDPVHNSAQVLKAWLEHPC